MFKLIKRWYCHKLLNNRLVNSIAYFEKRLQNLAKFMIKVNMPFFFNMEGDDDITKFKIELILMKNHKLTERELNIISAACFGMNEKVDNIRNFVGRKTNEIVLFDGSCLRNCENSLEMYRVFDRWYETMIDCINVLDNLNE